MCTLVYMCTPLGRSCDQVVGGTWARKYSWMKTNNPTDSLDFLSDKSHNNFRPEESLNNIYFGGKQKH